MIRVRAKHRNQWNADSAGCSPKKKKPTSTSPVLVLACACVRFTLTHPTLYNPTSLLHHGILARPRERKASLLTARAHLCGVPSSTSLSSQKYLSHFLLYSLSLQRLLSPRRCHWDQHLRRWLTSTVEQGPRRARQRQQLARAMRLRPRWWMGKVVKSAGRGWLDRACVEKCERLIPATLTGVCN